MASQNAFLTPRCHTFKKYWNFVSVGTACSFSSDGQLHLSTKSPRYGDMTCDLRFAVTCLVVLALTLQSAAVQISISLPAKTYTALPDIFDINCVAFSLNSSGVFKSLWREKCSYVSLAGHSFASALCRLQALEVCLNVAFCSCCSRAADPVYAFVTEASAARAWLASSQLVPPLLTASYGSCAGATFCEWESNLLFDPFNYTLVILNPHKANTQAVVTGLSAHGKLIALCSRYLKLTPSHMWYSPQ